MRAKHAKLIRIGIMSRCLPYVEIAEPDRLGGHYSTLNYSRLRRLQEDWVRHSHEPLVQRARERTKSWISLRYE